MKSNTAIMVLLTSFYGMAQDTIVTFRGKHFPSSIVSITADSIRYKRTDYENSIDYLIDKNSVSEIRYGNGTTENFFTDVEKSVTAEGIKTHILEMINLYAYQEDSDKEKYVATFEGDLLRLSILEKGKIVNKGFLFDFSRVDQFHPVSERSRGSYVNIYVWFLDNPKKMSWDKRKLIIRIKGHNNALDIQRSLQYFNFLLKEQKKLAAVKL